MITLLQISDIHFKASSVDENDLNDIKGKFVNDIAAYVDNGHGSIDHILICGDIANSGSVNEYEEAKTFIERIKVRAQCDKVHIVPGNHDMDRTKCPEYRKYMAPLIRENSTKFITLARSNKLVADVLTHFWEPFKHYNTFAFDYDSISDIDNKCITKKRNKIIVKDRCSWTHELGNENGYRISLTGVNTALLSDCPGKEILPSQMYNHEKGDKEICLIMAHHPLMDIDNGGVIERHLDNSYVLQFYGHRHEQSFKKGRAVKIYSGAFGPEPSPTKEEEDKYSPVYNIVKLTVQSNSLIIGITTRRWSWDAGGFLSVSIPSLELPLLSEDPWAESESVSPTKEDISYSSSSSGVKTETNPASIKMLMGFDKSWALFNNLGKDEQKKIMSVLTGSSITSLDALAKSSFKQHAQGDLSAFSNELIKVIMGIK